MRYPALLALSLTCFLAGCATDSSSPTAPVQAGAPLATSERDGSSFERAIVITAKDESSGVTAEYAWVRANIPGGRPAGQALLFHEKKAFDKLRVALPDGTIREVFFDISSFFGKY